MGLVRSQYYYQSRKDDSGVITALQELAAAHPIYGFRKLFACLKRAGKLWNHKKVYRIYKLLKLNKKRRSKRRLPARVKQPLLEPVERNSSWSMDFMTDSLASGRKLRTLNIIDDCNREALVIEVATSINIQYIQPGKPMQNGYIERFNGSYRREILDAYWFFDLEEVRQLTSQWIEEYNTKRPHEALKNLSPSEWPIQNKSGNMENLPQHLKPTQKVYHIPTS